MFYTSLQANEQIYHETYGGMCCISFMLGICMEKTGIIVLFMTCSKRAERSIGEGVVLCNAAFHFDYSPTFRCVIHGLLRSEKTSMIPDLQNADQTIAARAAHLAPRRQEYPRFPGPFCPDVLTPVCFVVPHPCSH